MIANTANVKLLSVPLDNEYKHTLYFADRTAQTSYFTSLNPSKTFTDFSFIPKESKLRVNLTYDEARQYNYVMYKNPNNVFWKYAFITGYDWASDAVTELTIETDVIQTYQFAIRSGIKPSFVEREHVKDDTIGAHTIPENLEIGEYVTNFSVDFKPYTSVSIVMGVTASPIGDAYQGTRYTGTYSGIHYYAFPYTTAGVGSLNNMIKLYSDNGRSEAIVSMFLAPSQLANVPEGSTSVVGSETPYNTTFEMPRKIPFKTELGYTEPKNKKLYTYPYNYLLISNNNGGSAIYQFEHFENETISFLMYGVLTPGCSIRLIPYNYKNVSPNHEEGLNLGKFPICNWSSDEYTNWLTQNSVNIGMNMVSGLGQIIAGGAIAVHSAGLGGIVGGSQIVGGVTTITNQLAQIHQMSFTPPQTHGNINSGDVITAINKNTFTAYQMCCKPEYMKVIDNYFSVYGYKCNRIKIPEYNHRENWWFTKTIDLIINDPDIPFDDLEKIKSIYNNGITYWRSTSKIKDYDQSNNIL